MYIPDSFGAPEQTAVFSMMERYDFATIITSTPRGDLFVTHLPLLLKRSEHRAVLLGHVAHENDHWHYFDGSTDSLAIFRGPHGYVSPTWYLSEPAVPTWNYAVVHVYGYPRATRDRQTTFTILEALVRKYEDPRLRPWRIEELPQEFLEKMLTRIVAFQMPIERIESKFKLSQNRSRADREGVVRGLSVEGSEAALDLRALMLENLNVSTQADKH
jgi:transcriptional regulator